jgi:hypothetical protein
MKEALKTETFARFVSFRLKLRREVAVKVRYLFSADGSAIT